MSIDVPLAQHPLFDASLVERTEPYWWHAEPAADWHFPTSRALATRQDEVLIEKEEPDVR